MSGVAAAKVAAVVRTCRGQRGGRRRAALAANSPAKVRRRKEGRRLGAQERGSGVAGGAPTASAKQGSASTSDATSCAASAAGSAAAAREKRAPMRQPLRPRLP